MVLITVEALLADNTIDARIAGNKNVPFYHNKKRTLILGDDIAGTVEEVGDGVENFKKGDVVYGMTLSGLSGGYAEYVVTKVDAIAPKPESIDFEEAALISLFSIKKSIADLSKNTANGLTAKTLRSRRASKKFSARTNLFGGYYYNRKIEVKN